MACFFSVSHYTRSLIFPNSRKKKKEKTQKLMLSYVLPGRAFAPYMGRLITHWVVLVCPLPLVACKTAVVQDLCLAQGDYEDRNLPRKVWLFFIFFSVFIKKKTGASVRRQITRRLAWLLRTCVCVSVCILVCHTVVMQCWVRAIGQVTIITLSL